MVIKKGFFTKVKYEVNGNVLIKSIYTFFGLFHKKDEDLTFDLSEVKYIDQIPMDISLCSMIVSVIFSRKRYGVELVKEHDSLYLPNLTKSEVDELISIARQVGAEQRHHEYELVPSFKAMRRIYRGYSIICEQFGKMCHKSYNKKDCSNDQIFLADVLYFDEIEKNGIKGVAFGYVASGGDAHTIEVFGLSEENNQQIYKMIVAANPKLSDKHVSVFRSIFPLFSPKRWFKSREVLIVADWGLLHKQYGVIINGKKFKNRTSVMPYESIRSFDCDGIFLKKMHFAGSTSILTEEFFSRKAKTYIWLKLKQEKIVNDLGIKFKSMFLYRWGILGEKDKTDKEQLILSDTLITWKLKKEIRVLPYDKIYDFSFKKRHWYSLVGTVLIKGRRTDARAGEGGDVVMQIDHVWFSKGNKIVQMISFKNK